MSKPWVIATVGVLAAAVGFGGGYLINHDGDSHASSDKAATAAHADGGGKAVTEPLRKEHEALHPKVESLREAGDAVGTVPVKDLRAKVVEAHEFLVKGLVPHAEAENEVLYTEINHLLGTDQATKTMARDHVEVAKLTEELGALEKKLDKEPNAETQLELRQTLYGLYRLVDLHFAKEEEVYLPILEAHLTVEQGKELFEKMGEAAEKQGGDHGGHSEGGSTGGGHSHG